jgi:hypothetical protein
MFNSAADAATAAADLRQAGFRNGDIEIVSQTDGYVSTTTLRRKEVAAERADEYAEAVRQGAVLVLVSPPMGTAGLAEEVLSRRYPDDTVPARTYHEGPRYDESVPLSSALGIPVLLSDKAAFSRVLGIPELSRQDFYLSRLFGLPLLTRGPAFLSRLLGLRLLSHNPAPLSSLLRLPVLLRS